MGLLIVILGGWPLIISLAVFVGSVFIVGPNRQKRTFFLVGFVSFVLLAFGTYYYFSNVDIQVHTGGAPTGESLGWIIRGLMAWALLPAIASFCGSFAAFFVSDVKSSFETKAVASSGNVYKKTGVAHIIFLIFSVIAILVPLSILFGTWN